MAVTGTLSSSEKERYVNQLNDCILSQGSKLLSGIRTNMKICMKTQRNLYYLLMISDIINNLSYQTCITTEQLTIVLEKINTFCLNCQLSPSYQAEISLIRNCTDNYTANEEEFESLKSGQTVTLAYVPCPDTPIQVYRNGVHQDDPGEYSISGKIITFVEPFGDSVGGAVAGESVYVEYITSFS